MAAAAFLIAPHQHVLNTSMKQRFLPTIDVRLGTSLMHASSCTHPFDHFVSTLTVGECGLRSASVALRPGLRLKCILITLHTVRLRGIGTGISEASRRVPILPFATQRGKQESSYFRQGN